MKTGRLIVIEACCDGVGKTTQYNSLIRYLRKSGEDVVGHHFPTYNRSHGQAVVSYLAGHFGEKEKLSPYLINSLYAHDRAVEYHLHLKSELEQGKTIVLDRYTTSSMIYQTASFESIEKTNEFIKYIEDFEYNKLQIEKPDLVLFLSVDFEIAKEMREKRNQGKTEDIHESDEIFLKKVWDNSHYLADYLKWTKIDCSPNNELLPIYEISNKIQKYI